MKQSIQQFPLLVMVLFFVTILKGQEIPRQEITVPNSYYVEDRSGITGSGDYMAINIGTSVKTHVGIYEKRDDKWEPIQVIILEENTKIRMKMDQERLAILIRDTVMIYELGDTSWVRDTAFVIGEDFEDLNSFTGVIDLFGNQMVVSVSSSSGVLDTGYAFIYEFDTTGWTRKAVLQSPEEEYIGWFGNSVSIREDKVFVYSSHNNPSISRIFFYEKDSTGSWVYRQLLEPHVSLNNGFGRSMYIGGDFLLLSENKKILYFKRENGLWVEKEQILHSHTQFSGSGFGWNFHCDDSLLVTGSKNTMQVYRRQGDKWLFVSRVDDTSFFPFVYKHFAARVYVMNGDLFCRTDLLANQPLGDGRVLVFDVDSLPKVTSCVYSTYPADQSDNVPLEGTVITWDSVSNATGYRLWLRDDTFFDSPPEFSIDVGQERTFDLGTLSNNHVLVYQIVPQDTGHTISYCPNVTFRTLCSFGKENGITVVSPCHGHSVGLSSIALGKDYMVMPGGFHFSYETQAFSGPMIFNKDGGEWIYQNIVYKKSPEYHQEYYNEQDKGFVSVSMNDSVIIAGGYKRDYEAWFSYKGVVEIYENTGGDWTHKQRVVGVPSKNGDKFGYSVKLYGNHFIVGAPDWYEQSGDNKGMAFIYSKDTTGQWTLTKSLTPDDSHIYDKYGWSVSISDSFAVVGAYGNRTTAPYAGAAYVYRLVDGHWQYLQKLEKPQPVAFDNYGYSVAIDGDMIAIGSPGDDGEMSISGAVYLYKWNGENWNLAHVVYPENGEYQFGRSLDLKNGRLVASMLRNSGQGKLTCYRFEDEQWIKEGNYSLEDEELGFFFAEKVLLGDSLVLALGKTYVEGHKESAAYMINCDELTDITEPVAASSFGNILLYPNPALNELHISIPDEQTTNQLTIEFYQVDGKKIRSSGFSGDIINIEGLQSGLYFVALRDGNRLIGRGRFVKM